MALVTGSDFYQVGGIWYSLPTTPTRLLKVEVPKVETEIRKYFNHENKVLTFRYSQNSFLRSNQDVRHLDKEFIFVGTASYPLQKAFDSLFWESSGAKKSREPIAKVYSSSLETSKESRSRLYH